MDKLNRNYILRIETVSGAVIIIKPPFTVEFDLTRNTSLGTNVAKFRIYNLSSDRRNQIRKNPNSPDDIRSVSFQAGYGDNMPTVFTGTMTYAFSVREGNNFITEIDSFDGGQAFTTGYFAGPPFPAGTPMKTVVATIAKTLPGVAVGAISDLWAGATIPRGNTYEGPSCKLLSDLTGGAFFIDNGQANVLGPSDCLAGGLLVIDSKSGLLGTPTIEQTYINLEMIFEPRVQVGQVVHLNAITDKKLTGDYRVNSIKHRGIISEAVAGEATTTIGLFAGLVSLLIVDRYNG